MFLKTKSVKISGSPSEKGWSQCYECSSQNEGGNVPRRQLLVVFSTIKNNPEVDNAEIGRKLLDRLCALYLNGNHGSNSLKEAVGEAFNEFFQQLDGLEISAAGYSEGVLYTACINGGKAALYRDTFLVKILDSNSPKVISASGHPKEGDVMVLAAGDLYNVVSYPQLKDVLSKGVETAEDELSVKLHNVSAVGIILLGFSAGSEEVDYDNTIRTPPQINKDVIFAEERSQTQALKTKHIVNKLKILISRRKIYLHKDHEPTLVKSKKTLFIGAFLTILLGISVFFGVYKNKDEAYKSSYAERLNQAEVNISEAINLKNIEIGRARELFLQGREILNGLVNEGIKDPKIDDLNRIVLDNEVEILGETKITGELWLDLTLITNGFDAEDFCYYDGDLYVLDREKNTLINIEFENKRSETEKPDGEIDNSQAVICGSGGVFILGSDGVYDPSDRVIEKNWGEKVKIATYGANIYLLDEGKGEIVKFSALEDGFSEGKKWTTSESEDLSGTRSFVIDGWVWVLLPNGSVKKYSYGNEIPFELKGYPFDLPDYDRLYTNEEADNLYLMDKESGIISVFDKEGEYKKNIIADVIREGKDLIVLENEGKILLLTGGKVYEININY